MVKKPDHWLITLEQFKRKGKPEAVLMVAGSAELTRIALAWCGMSVVRKKKLKSSGRNDEENLWRWLWDNVEYPQEEFLNRVPGATAQTPQKFAALVANRIVYPDGTVNSFVSKYMKERVLNLFKISTKTRQSRRT